MATTSTSRPDRHGGETLEDNRGRRGWGGSRSECKSDEKGEEKNEEKKEEKKEKKKEKKKEEKKKRRRRRRERKMRRRRRRKRAEDHDTLGETMIGRPHSNGTAYHRRGTRPRSLPA